MFLMLFISILIGGSIAHVTDHILANGVPNQAG
jgi:hypothetical protein